MKKYIHATKEQREHLMRIFKCKERTIRNALTFDEARGNTDLARKIYGSPLCRTVAIPML